MHEEKEGLYLSKEEEEEEEAHLKAEVWNEGVSWEASKRVVVCTVARYNNAS